MLNRLQDVFKSFQNDSIPAKRVSVIKIEEAAKCIKEFENGDLTDRVFALETVFRNKDKSSVKTLCEQQNLTPYLLKSAFAIKNLAGQINVVIHGIGILAALPEILEDNERIEYLSLGAGNTGRKFDLETNIRVAEFKFITWQGGAESIRQNSLFKDFYSLAEYDTHKKKCLYLLGTKIPNRFFNGGRSLKSVLSKDAKLSKEFFLKYGDHFEVVRDYFRFHSDKVQIIDIFSVIPGLTEWI